MYRNLRINPAFDTIFRQHDFDLVHAHFGTGGMYALPFAKRHDLPLVVTFHGYDVAALIGRERNKYHNRRYARVSGKIFDYASMILAASTELRSLLIELGAPPGKVRVYRLGVDLDRFSYRPAINREADAPVRFIMIGRFTPKKGHIYTINALQKVLAKGLDAELHLVGTGEIEDTCRELAVSLGIKNHVVFHGVLSSLEVSDLLSESDVLVAPSVTAFDHDRESGLIVVKEASAVGLPVIGTWHGGIPEIIEDHKTGLLVPERDPGRLAEAMTELARDPDKRSKYGENARNKMESEYDLFERVRELERLYEEILSQS